MPPRDRRSAESTSLGLFWDAFLAGDNAGDEALPRAATETVRALHELDDVPGPDPQLVARMWAEAVRQAGTDRVPVTSPSVTHAEIRRTGLSSDTIQHLLRTLYAASLAGAIAGALTIGLGLRAAMRVSGLLTDPARRGLLTEAGNRVGEFTVAGTLVLVLLGAAFGIAGGLAYAIVRPWLPWSGGRRGLLFGAALFALAGSSLFENGRNPDYREFGIPGVNVCLFGFLPILYGLVVAPLSDRLQHSLVQRERRLPAHPKQVVTWQVSILGLALFFTLIVVLAEPALLGLVALVPIRAGLAHLVGRFDSPADLLRRPVVALPAYALVILPCLVGLALTLQAIERILV